MQPFTINDFKTAKNTRKISMLTAYDYSMARLLDEAGVDALLVGDSLGMVVQGYDTTLQVTMTDILYHTKAVVRGTTRAFVVADLPFLSYQVTVEDAIRNAGRLIQEGGAKAVKLEGGQEILPQITGILKAQIPVMGHLGLTPQSVHKFGGFRVQGKELPQAKQLLADALALESAGVFAIVLEGIPAELATFVTSQLTIPTIGIGASAGCDGQVLVIHDMLGLFSDFTPKFVKHYAHLKDTIIDSVQTYIQEVQAGDFPDYQHTFKDTNHIAKQLQLEE